MGYLPTCQHVTGLKMFFFSSNFLARFPVCQLCVVHAKRQTDATYGRLRKEIEFGRGPGLFVVGCNVESRVYGPGCIVEGAAGPLKEIQPGPSAKVEVRRPLLFPWPRRRQRRRRSPPPRCPLSLVLSRRGLGNSPAATAEHG